MSSKELTAVSRVTSKFDGSSFVLEVKASATSGMVVISSKEMTAAVKPSTDDVVSVSDIGTIGKLEMKSTTV